MWWRESTSRSRWTSWRALTQHRVPCSSHQRDQDARTETPEGGPIWASSRDWTGEGQGQWWKPLAVWCSLWLLRNWSYCGVQVQSATGDRAETTIEPEWLAYTETGTGSGTELWWKGSRPSTAHQLNKSFQWWWNFPPHPPVAHPAVKSWLGRSLKSLKNLSTPSQYSQWQNPLERTETSHTDSLHTAHTHTHTHTPYIAA